MLTASDLERNVLDFRHRTFQFDRTIERSPGACAVFHRTETESERQLRPRLLRLTVVVPVSWIVYDEAAEALRITRERAARPPAGGSAVEVAAEPSEFEEDGIRWKRTPAGPAGYVYVPAELAGDLLSPEGRRELGVP